MDEITDILSTILKSDERVFKIQYSMGLQSDVDCECVFFNSSHKILSIQDLSHQNIDVESAEHTPLQQLLKSTIQNLIGLIPVVGTISTSLFIVADIVDYNVKKSDIDTLKAALKMKNKPAKSYRKSKNIILIKNSSLLSLDEVKYLSFIAKLIKMKYISDTILLIFDPIEIPCPVVLESHDFYLRLEERLQTKYNIDCKQNPKLVNLLNIVGIEYAEIVCALQEEDIQSDKIIERLIDKILAKSKCNSDKDIHTFLTLCSLLFDKFSQEDAEKVSQFEDINSQIMLNKTLGSKIIRRSGENIKTEFEFLQRFIREYYQNSDNVLPMEVYTKIFMYLKEKYPTSYTDLALISNIIQTDICDIQSCYIIAYYHDNSTTSNYKLRKIKDYLRTFSLGELILKTDDAYREMQSIYTTLQPRYSLSIDEIMNSCISVEAKLASLNYVARIKYEFETDPQELLKVGNLYRKLLAEINFFSKPTQSKCNYALDYILFSTCIENDYVTRNVVQKVIMILNKIYNSRLDNAKYLRFLRLGNALYPSDIGKGMELTRRSYYQSENYVREHELSAINYSASLIVTGDYTEATNVLKETFGFGRTGHPSKCDTNIIRCSARNNFLVAKFFDVSIIDKMDMAYHFANLLKDVSNHSQMNGVKEQDFSDKIILKNNYISAQIMSQTFGDTTSIENSCIEIEKSTNDPYHKFYVYQNLMILYFFLEDKEKFKEISKKCVIPKLLEGYKDFFDERKEFLYHHIHEKWDIAALTTELEIWGKQYPDKKYSLYKNPVFFGLIERWFE